MPQACSEAHVSLTLPGLSLRWSWAALKGKWPLKDPQSQADKRHGRVTGNSRLEPEGSQTLPRRGHLRIDSATKTWVLQGQHFWKCKTPIWRNNHGFT